MEEIDWIIFTDSLVFLRIVEKERIIILAACEQQPTTHSCESTHGLE